MRREITSHAAARMTSRNITPEQIQLCIRHGEKRSCRIERGSRIYVITPSIVRDKPGLAGLEWLKVVIGQDGAVITAYRDTTPGNPIHYRKGARKNRRAS
jgi:hypothetical protein